MKQLSLIWMRFTVVFGTIISFKLGREKMMSGIIDGGDIKGCKGLRTHQGIKRIWAYYAYARYIMINGFNDTPPSGMVAKTNQVFNTNAFERITSLFG